MSYFGKKEIIVWKSGNELVEARLYQLPSRPLSCPGGSSIDLDPKEFSSWNSYKFSGVSPTRISEEDEDVLCEILGGSASLFNGPFGTLGILIPDEY